MTKNWILKVDNSGFIFKCLKSNIVFKTLNKSPIENHININTDWNNLDELIIKEKVNLN